MSDDNLNLKVEAVLFSYGDWVSISEIKEALAIESDEEIKKALTNLAEKYKENHSFVVEQNENSEWRMALREEYDEIVTALISGTEIPRNVLKVLSVIAYEQPVTKTRLSEIVGRYVKPEVDYLFKAKFLNYEKQGNARYYRVTNKFYDYFKIDNEEEFRKQADKNMKEMLKDPVKMKKVEKELKEQSEAQDFNKETNDIEGEVQEEMNKSI